MSTDKIVYKYALYPITDYITILLPTGAHVLHVAEQNGQPHLWALVDPNAEPEERTFRIAGTGHKITAHPELFDYVGTFQMLGGSLVFHVFEVRR